MRERPILFTGPMVRAIQDDLKTQTRRPVKPQPTFADGHYEQVMRPGVFCWIGPDNGLMLPYEERACPFGQPGDRLWVREPGRVVDCFELDAREWEVTVRYVADGEERDIMLPARLIHLSSGSPPDWAYSKQGIPNGIFREAARIFLEIVSVRVERLQEISEADARAEGFESRAEFLAAFRAMYKLAPDANPWLWVVEFKRVEGEA